MTQIPVTKLLFLFAFSWGICSSRIGYAQKDTTEHVKTFRVKVKVGDTIRFEQDSIFTHHKDTVLHIPRDMSYSHSSIPQKKDNAFYDSLEVKYGHKRLTRHLLDALLTSTADTTARKRAKEEFIASEELFKPYNGLIIKAIRIMKVPIMSGSVQDTTYNKPTWGTEVANRLHVNTKDRVIRNNLLFKSGEKISAYTMADNERLIRSLRFIEDAKIMVSRIKNTQFAEVVVVTKDVWSIGASLDISGTDRYNIEVYDRNLFGLGNELSSTALVNTTETPAIGYNGEYRINNIKGTFIDALAQYRHTYREEITRLKFDRAFFTPQTKYAGGFEILRQSELTDIQPLSTETDITRATYRQQELWAGKSINLTDNGNRRNILLSAAAANKAYIDRPFISIDSNFAYHDRRLYLGKIAYSKRTYYKGNFVNRFGITEDIPVGHFYAITFGKESSTFKDRFYQQFNYLRSYVFRNKTYLLTSAALAWYRIGDRTEDGMFRVWSQYVSKLYKLSDRYQTRFNTRLTYTLGFDRVNDERLRLTDFRGIRGIDEPDLTGTERLSLQLEMDFITKWHIIGFRFFPYIFVDVGLLNHRKGLLIHHKNISNGIGAGLRVRNESLVFSTFEIRFSYYPRTEQASNTAIDFFSRNPSILRDFNQAKPEPLSFD